MAEYTIDKFSYGGNIYNLQDSVTDIPPEMVVLSYGISTWADFEAAYSTNSVVYCRASSNADPSTGDQKRLAFMAYVNSATPASITEVEFQYYRSVATHTISQQGDQVFVYKLNKSTGWSVTTREASTKIAVGSTMTGSYSNGTLTLNAIDELPTVTAGDNGKTLAVVGGNWEVADSGSYTLPIATASRLGGIKPDETTLTVNSTTGIASVLQQVTITSVEPTASNFILWIDPTGNAGQHMLTLTGSSLVNDNCVSTSTDGTYAVGVYATTALVDDTVTVVFKNHWSPTIIRSDTSAEVTATLLKKEYVGDYYFCGIYQFTMPDADVTIDCWYDD